MKFMLLFFMTPTLCLAALSECGEYEIKGVVKAGKAGYEIVVNEKTRSELRIQLPTAEQLKVLPYADRAMTANVLLQKKFDGTKGLSDKIISIKTRIPNPLDPQDTGLSLITKSECK